MLILAFGFVTVQKIIEWFLKVGNGHRRDTEAVRQPVGDFDLCCTQANYDLMYNNLNNKRRAYII